MCGHVCVRVTVAVDVEELHQIQNGTADRVRVRVRLADWAQSGTVTAEVIITTITVILTTITVILTTITVILTTITVILTN